jgi:cytochrome c biogenesis protein CcdA/thiol-disulfide isomerase/thioredoxin
MAILLAFAFFSGLITILSPCILPILPLVLAGGSGGGRSRPLGVIAGFVASFSFFTLALSLVVDALGIPGDSMRWVAIALVAAFGLTMLVPPLGRVFERLASRLAPQGQGQALTGKRRGFWSGLVLGLGLGLVWAPCVGPIMASVISLALTRRVDGGSISITLAYALGTALPMLAVMFGGRSLVARWPFLSRRSASLQRAFGIVMLAMALVLGLQWDRKFQAAVLAAFPGYGSGLTSLEKARPVQEALAARKARLAQAPANPAKFSGVAESAGYEGSLGDYGAAPDFVAQGPWLNSAPLDLETLRGKVVLVDFWTYSCVNCVRTLPWLKDWYGKYGGQGLVVIGVHSPEFAFERSEANVKRAMGDLGVAWPVVLDNSYAQWEAYGNRYWPAHYLIDAAGRVRYWHFGEGAYEETEAAILRLLSEAGSASTGGLAMAPFPAAAGPGTAPAALEAKTPETYLGIARSRGFASAVAAVADIPLDYRPARSPANGEWNLAGSWIMTSEYVEPEARGSLELGFDAKDVYLVIEPGEGAAVVTVTVDGQVPPDTADLRSGVVRPGESRLYHLVSLPRGGPHLLRLVVEGKPRFFAFTFG